jgi:hypothetical protein
MTRQRKPTGPRPESRKKWASWRITIDEHARIKSSAEKMGMTMAELIDLAVKAFLDKNGC